MNENIKAIIVFEGDISVGIPEREYEAILDIDSVNENREFARKQIQDCYYQIDGNQVPRVIFLDEFKDND